MSRFKRTSRKNGIFTKTSSMPVPALIPVSLARRGVSLRRGSTIFRSAERGALQGMVGRACSSEDSSFLDHLKRNPEHCLRFLETDRLTEHRTSSSSEIQTAFAFTRPSTNLLEALLRST